MKPPPWWKTYPRQYWTAAERAAAIKDGWKPSAAETRQNVFEEQRIRVSKHLPQPAPLFTGQAPERVEDYERRQRQQRAARLLAKHGIGQRPGPLGWRV